MRLNIRHFLTFSFWFELFCFAFSVYLAIGLAIKLFAETPPVPVNGTMEYMGAWQFVLAFLIATLVLFLLLKYVKKPWIISGLFYLAILEGLWLFSIAYLEWPGNLLFMAIAILLWWLYNNIFIHDLIIILAISAIAVIFGSNIAPSSGILILLFLAVYDYWAVYKTTHMVQMFKGMAESKVYFSLVIPHTFNGLFKKMKLVSPNVDFMFLGTGDIALPAIFIVSCLQINLLTSLITAIGSLFGFILLYIVFITQKEPKPMPGLPLIVLGTLAGYLVAILIS
jgi:presenilin-like A22 family membrane protease